MIPPELAKYVAATIPTVVIPLAYHFGLPEGLCAGILAIWLPVVGAHVGKDLMGHAKEKKSK